MSEVGNIIEKFKEGLTLDGKKKVFEDERKLSSDFLLEKSDPEAFTKEFLIEPVLRNLGLKKLPEKHFKGIKGDLRKVDYLLKNDKNISFLAEAKPLNSDLFEKGVNGAINQIKGIFRLAEVRDNYEFGIATDGLKWVFIDKNSKVVYFFDVTKEFDKIEEILVGKQEVSSEKMEEEISKKFYDWYNALMHGGKYKDHDNKTKEISTKDCLIENIISVPKLEDREQIAQILLDRLIFVKFLQSKGIVSYDVLKYLSDLDENILNAVLRQLFFHVFSKKKSKRFDVYPKFKDIPYLNGSLFERADVEIRNSDYKIRAYILKEIIKFLDSFKFTHKEKIESQQVLDPTILGYIFERAMTATDRKGTGAFYTPKPITKYISENTIHPVIVKKVNKLLKEKGYKDTELLKNIDEVYRLRESTLGDVFNNVVLELKVCDNACGSGAFLLAVAEVLLEIYRRISDELRLRNSEIALRKLILKNNLYGVDINPNAIEISKLRLWLWLVTAYEPDKIEPLPNIDYNIRCGNSLIGYVDITEFKSQKLTLFDFSNSEKSVKILLKQREETITRYKDAVGDKAKEHKSQINEIDQQIKKTLDMNLYKEITKDIKLNKNEFDKLSPFHWGFEFFNIFNGNGNGGFDVILGNPPYVRQEEITTSMKKIFKKYKVYHGSSDLYTYFFERGLNILKTGGLFSFIVSSKFTKTKYGKNLRKFILDSTKIKQFIDFNDLPIFKDATTYPCIIILDNSRPKKGDNVIVSKLNNLVISDLDKIITLNSFTMKQEYLSENPWILDRTETMDLIEKIRDKGVHLKKIIGDKLYRGVTTGCNEAFIINEEQKNKFINKDSKSKKIIRKLITGKDIKRYSLNFKNRYLIYSYTGIDIGDFPAIKEHLMEFKGKLDKVWEVKHGKHPWYELRGCSYYDKLESKKIVYPRINIRPNFTMDDEGIFIQDSAFIIPSTSKFILGILNSKLMNFYAKRVCSLLRGGYYDYRYQYVEKFPIVDLIGNIKNKLENMVDEILLNNEKLKVESLEESEKREVKKKIKELDKKIDEIVYEIYEITKKEIEIIENDVS
jgi:hypothetical protein